MPLKNNSVYFNQVEFKKKINTAIKNGFDKDPNRPDKFWYLAFGKKKIKEYKSFIKAVTSFPAYYLTLNAVPSTRYSHSTQINQYSRVLLEIHLKNVSENETDKETLGYEISNRIIQILQEEFGLVLTNLTNFPNYDDDVETTILRFVFVYDNINKIIYKGD